MKRVAAYSALLIVGLVGSQILPLVAQTSFALMAEPLRWLTMLCLAFLMIHVGLEFDIDRRNVRQYAVDYGIAATAAGFPWLLCAGYMMLVMNPSHWTEALLAARFAAPTSAGILFAMLTAAGLSASWTFRKARVLAIFDDLDTVLLMIPLKMLIVGMRWQLLVIILIMAVLLWIGWQWLHSVRWPAAWPWVLAYAAGITAGSEVVYALSKVVDDVVPIHIEVLLPAFILGCVLTRPSGHGDHSAPEHTGEQNASLIISAGFMVLVGLSMPPLFNGTGGASVGWPQLLTHTLWLTLLANLGKMFPLFCYRREAHWKERLALCVGMWPRGEVGAGVLVVSLGYGISGLIVPAAALSLALNLVLTGVFIMIVQRLLASAPPRVAA